MKYADQRKQMIETQIIDRGIQSPSIIKAFEKVPRELFVPEEFRRMTYYDCPLSIGSGQTISQPYMIAYMISLLDIQDDELVLEIGTGSGYQTALLGEIAEKVFTVERIPELLSTARDILDGLGYENIHYRIGDGTKGWEKAFPVQKEFHKIIVSASSPEIPSTLIEQLAEGGKLIIPTGRTRLQQLTLVTKNNGEIKKFKYGICTFVPLIGLEGWNN